MVDFIFSVFKVIGGSFCLFYVANSMLKSINPERTIGWCLTVGTLTFLVMLLYRLLGQPISTPFYTVFFFVITMGGMSSNFDGDFAPIVERAVKRARWFAIAGGLLGWMTYMETGRA